MSTKTETKAETPFTMPSFDPMAFWLASQQTFQKTMADAVGRSQSFAEQYAAFEKDIVTRAQTAVANVIPAICHLASVQPGNAAVAGLDRVGKGDGVGHDGYLVEEVRRWVT